MKELLFSGFGLIMSVGQRGVSKNSSPLSPKKTKQWENQGVILKCLGKLTQHNDH